MAVDGAGRVVFVGARHTSDEGGGGGGGACGACVLLLDMDSGELLARVAVPRAADMDDVHWDARRQRLYVAGGAGAVSVLGCVAGRTRSGRRWQVLADVPTSLGARTALWYPERDSLYVAAPETGDSPARLLVFQGCSNSNPNS